MNYVIVTPVRDEQDFIQHTLDSVVAQTIQPTRWVIVDDGSVDDTAQIVHKYVDKYPWLSLVGLLDRGYRKPGEGVAKVFLAGLERVGTDYDFIVKLDGDLSFAEDYFERLFQQFDKSPRLGIAGGGCYSLRGGHWVLERVPDDHVRGASKVYRRQCFEDIGGVESVNGWDTIDELKAQMAGWRTRSFNELQIMHHRSTFSALGSFQGWKKPGQFAYFLGYHPVYMLARCVWHMKEPPIGLRGVAMFWGYLQSWLEKAPVYGEKQVVAYLRRKQLRRLFRVPQR